MCISLTSNILLTFTQECTDMEIQKAPAISIIWPIERWKNSKDCTATVEGAIDITAQIEENLVIQ